MEQKKEAAKQVFEHPTMEIFLFDATDLITTSIKCEGINTPIDKF